MSLSMISKEKLRLMLQSQFGIYLNLEKYENAFDRSLSILDTIEVESNTDVFYLFIHKLILDLLERVEKVEKYCLDN